MLCRQLVHAGHYLASASPLLVVPGLAFALLLGTLPVPSRRRHRSHAWRSRGPPERSPLP